MRTLNNFLIIIIFCLFNTSVYSSPKIDARTFILLDHNSGEILAEHEADQNIYPASMTKIMTAIIAFDLI